MAAFIGNDDMGIQLLNEAVQAMTVHIYWAWLPFFDEVRRTSGFADVVEDAGLVANWNTHGWPDICFKTAEKSGATGGRLPAKRYHPGSSACFIVCSFRLFLC